MSDSNVRCVGLDVHKRVVEACLIDRDGAILRRDRLDMSRGYLETFAREVLRPSDRVALEATTNTWAVVGVLRPYVAEIAVGNPLATKAIATSKIKTDKVDALALAQLLRCDYLPKVWQPDEATQELRRLTAHRASLVADRTRFKNRLHSVLAQRLIQPPYNDLFSAKGRAWLAALELDAEGRLLIDSDLRLLGHVEEELLLIDKLIADRAYHEDRVKLLMTLPGVNVAVATGKRRTTGPRKGVKCVAKLPGGSRTIKPLERIYQEENLPALREPKPGERRMLRATGAADFHASLATEHIVARRPAKIQTATE